MKELVQPLLLNQFVQAKRDDSYYSYLGLCVFVCASVVPPPLEGFPLELGIGARGQITAMMGLPDRERSLGR